MGAHKIIREAKWRLYWSGSCISMGAYFIVKVGIVSSLAMFIFLRGVREWKFAD